jgi:hypothetical protein
MNKVCSLRKDVGAMESQRVYNLAEWLAHNRDTVLASVGEYNSIDHLKNKVMYIAAENFRHYPIEDVITAFDDEKLLLVFDFYYVNKRDIKQYSN